MLIQNGLNILNRLIGLGQLPRVRKKTFIILVSCSVFLRFMLYRFSIWATLEVNGRSLLVFSLNYLRSVSGEE